jgi:hypothetical protein
VFDVDLTDGPVPVQEWALARGAELVVRVRDEEGAPLRDMEVELTAPEHKDLIIDLVRTRDTDAEGVARFGGLYPGSHGVVARGAERPTVTAQIQVAEGTQELELKVPAGVPVTGTVTTRGGEPVAGALVIVEGENSHHRHHAMTDVSGRFRHASVAAGEYGAWALPGHVATLYLNPSGMRPPLGEPHASLTVGAAPVTLDLVLENLGTIAGTVRTADGDLIGGARVFAMRERGEGLRDQRGTPVLSDEHGRFRFEGLSDGTYGVAAYVPGGARVHRRGVKLGAENVDLVLSDLGSISGRVLHADGSPATVFRLWVEGQGKPPRSPDPVGSSTGRFRVEGLDAGRYAVMAFDPESRGEIEIDLAAGEDRTDVELTLEARTQVKGRLVDAGGKPLVDHAVAAIALETGEDGNPTWAMARPIEADGTFLIDNVQPPEVAIVVVPPPEGGFREGVFREAPRLVVVKPERGTMTDVGELVVE